MLTKKHRIVIRKLKYSLTQNLQISVTETEIKLTKDILLHYDQIFWASFLSSINCNNIIVFKEYYSYTFNRNRTKKEDFLSTEFKQGEHKWHTEISVSCCLDWLVLYNNYDSSRSCTVNHLKKFCGKHQIIENIYFQIKLKNKYFYLLSF